MKNEAMLKSQLMETEFGYNLQLKGLEQSQIDQRRLLTAATDLLSYSRRKF